MDYRLYDSQDDHEEADEESSKKAKFFFSTAVQNWDAEFYVKVDKDIHLDLGNFYLTIMICASLCFILVLQIL